MVDPPAPVAEVEPDPLKGARSLFEALLLDDLTDQIISLTTLLEFLIGRLCPGSEHESLSDRACSVLPSRVAEDPPVGQQDVIWAIRFRNMLVHIPKSDLTEPSYRDLCRLRCARYALAQAVRVLAGRLNPALRERVLVSMRAG